MRYTFTTHPAPDIDALGGVSALIYALKADGDFQLRFDSAPGPEWHDPLMGRFTVDVGKGPLDHHQLENPRSVCAFELVCRYLGTLDGYPATIGGALLRQLSPMFLRQDATGSITQPRDPTINLFGLPELMKRLVWACQDDQQAFRAAYPLLKHLFDEQVAEDLARTNPEACLRMAHVWVRQDGRVASFEVTRVAGNYDSLGSLREIVLRHYPSVNFLVDWTTWTTKDGRILSHSRNLGCRRSYGLDCAKTLEQAERKLKKALRDETASWHREEWFCGAGSLKYPRLDPPPRDFIAALVAAIP